MFKHIFKYTLKTLFRKKMLIFWTFAFPIILGTFFNLAFSDIEKSETLDIVKIAIINNDEFDKDITFKEAFKYLSDEENKERLFNIEYTNLDKAEEMLKNNEITGYLLIENNTPKVKVNKNGVNETIFSYAVDEIQVQKQMINTLLSDSMGEVTSGDNIGKIITNIMNLVGEQKANLNNVSRKNLSYTMIEFYTLIAMSCLYGGIIAMTAINDKLANMNGIGKRNSVTPVSKTKLVLGSLSASYVIQLIGTFILFIYTIFVLKVDYGTNLPLIILLACVGSFAGLCIGIAVGTLLKTGEGAKVGILIALTMAWCYLAGMMGITMKYVIDTNVPILNNLNPVNMITDGLYALYYYDSLNRYTFNLISLLIFSCLMIIISFRALRRQKYDSI